MARRKRSAVPLRSPWVPALARAIDWHPQRLRNRFGKRGLVSPFARKELAALRILKEDGIDFSKYRPSDDAVGVDLETLELPPRQNGNGTAVVVRPPEQLVTRRKPNSHWGHKIIPRLARLLPEGDTKEGKMRVRWILRQGGWEGKPGHIDEATALDIFKKTNLSIEKFEYGDSPGEARESNPETPEELAARLKNAYEQIAARDATIMELRKTRKEVRDILMQYETSIVQEVYEKRLPGIGVKPLNYPLDALALIRYDQQTKH
jgi:hypothetical protein